MSLHTSTDKKYLSSIPELWAGLECTINRVGNSFRDQFNYSGHYTREGDLEAIASLGIKKLRYPVLWEKHAGNEAAWDWTSAQLNRIRDLGIVPIAGLVHHGSGPVDTDLMDPMFPEKLAAYALEVASRFPWLSHYTPVNEPLTTARFSGLYGLWYPHRRNGKSFARMIVNQCKAIVLAMKAIRRVNPSAQLVQTEDLGKTYSTAKLSYQARFENIRRWLSYDLICGKVNKRHRMWGYLSRLGISQEELGFFLENPCPPDIMGFNYYITSERFLDHRTRLYPPELAGGNGQHRYADVEAARVDLGKRTGLAVLLKEAWERYHIPLAITEVHIGCTREEQMRWLFESWNTAFTAIAKGIDVRAVTPWSVLGAYDWNSLLTVENRHYESGVFDVSGGRLRPTALAALIRELASGKHVEHPLLIQEGWWRRKDRFLRAGYKPGDITGEHKGQPLLVIGRNGTLARAFRMIADIRAIPMVCLSRNEVDILDRDSIAAVIDRYKPWGLINCAGYVNVDKAETEQEKCMQVNAAAPALIASVCKLRGIPFMTFSSDLVFGGDKHMPYTENDAVDPLNIYGQSKVLAEANVINELEQSLVIRSSAFFGPWDKYNFVYEVLRSMEGDRKMEVPHDVIVSPTYVPDLVNASLDLFIDEARGIWHVTNAGSVSWADFAQEVARQGVLGKGKIVRKQIREMNLHARRPVNSALRSERGIGLPTLDNALERYFKEVASV